MLRIVIVSQETYGRLSIYSSYTYRLSFADCFVVTPARKMDAVIMTGDPEFKNVEHIIEIEWLAK